MDGRVARRICTSQRAPPTHPEECAALGFGAGGSAIATVPWSLERPSGDHPSALRCEQSTWAWPSLGQRTRTASSSVAALICHLSLSSGDPSCSFTLRLNHGRFPSPMGVWPVPSSVPPRTISRDQEHEDRRRTPPWESPSQHHGQRSVAPSRNHPENVPDAS